MGNLLLGLDIGTSSVKAAVLDADSGLEIAHVTSPASGEIGMASPQPGWAEQNPDDWWRTVLDALERLSTQVELEHVKAIGIAYQMHGLVLTDEGGQPVRPAIIWCDSRAVPYGEKLAAKAGVTVCAKNLLNLPGNFTAAKLAWVAENEPEVFAKAHRMMLPGDYIALQLSTTASTTPTGLSEMILWDHKKEQPFPGLCENPELLPTVVPTFGIQAELTNAAAAAFGLPLGTPITYRAGDQPNNALALGVLDPGQAAANAGTSGVVYSVTGQAAWDKKGRVNTFLHVNHEKANPRRGILLCINGTGSLYSWLRRTMRTEGFPTLNEMAVQAEIGAGGLSVLPYGNGSERSLGNADMGASIHGIRFPEHDLSHIVRASQEGIAFSLRYGMEAMAEIGDAVTSVNAGQANLFLSPLFQEIFVNATGAELTLYDSDGALGAALGAGVGLGLFSAHEGAERALQPIRTQSPDPEKKSRYDEAYALWRDRLHKALT